MMITMVVASAPALMLMALLPNIAYCSPLSSGDHMHFQAPTTVAQSPPPSLSTESPAIPHNTHENPVLGTPKSMKSIVKPSGVSSSWLSQCPYDYPGLEDLLFDLGALLTEGLNHIDGYVTSQWCHVFQGPSKGKAEFCFCENLRHEFGYKVEVGRELLSACLKKPTKAFCRDHF
ncbi:hypothetical protein SUGI_0806050 [Cryptomeria japonica]|nr:hypothetical protein SUGI_0806050 [Cryptomeria japonica]